ncbi:biopolymer transporter ExbD [Plasticicumulans acidivorans]|uniref:Cell division and transport-associated protein TolR n=1 Tax=Plasticicumulans acidivorans TaxID=886464 RepID=A0A317MT46_9GAMM|nr:biopolymer transporter ExbD [Plasticicumulans acidivorans]PWV60587.1 cell division and transport-associated protein TolR [Plasticicumulans acidivorans]
MARRSSRKKVLAEMNVVPFIDVMLVLLIIFMAVTPIINQSVEIELPQAQKTSEVEQGPDEPPVIVSVYENGSITVGRGTRDVSAMFNLDDPTQAAEAKVTAEHFLGADAASKTVLVAGHRTASYEKVLAVINRISEWKVAKVGLMSTPAEQ